MRRTTIRWNDLEELELDVHKRNFHITDDSKAIKIAVKMVNTHIKNVAELFIPPDYEMFLVKKKKNETSKRKIYD